MSAGLRNRRRAVAVMALAVVFLLSGCGSGGEEGETTGAALYKQSCQSCHGDAATGAGRVGNVPSHGPAGHTWHHPDGQLIDILLGRFQFPGRIMPSFEGKLSEDEVASILAYIKQGWTAEQRVSQKEMTRAYEEARP